VEPELHALLPASVAMYSARLPLLPGDLQQRNAAYASHYQAAIASFGTLRLNAFYIGSTGATYTLGPEGDRALSDSLTAACGKPVWTASRAILDALRALGCATICLVSPYPDWLTDLAVAYWEAAGLRVEQVVKLGEIFRAYELETAEVLEGLQRLRPPAGSAVLLSGTGMLTLPAITSEQARFSVPLLSSNLCGAWALSRSLACPASASLSAAAPALAAFLPRGNP
jgi:maleate isomerase